MAVGEPKQQAKSWWRITQVSWTDWVTQDVYYWLEHSFQYAKNINCDDEMHWIKLSNAHASTTDFKKCQLVSVWEHGVMALPIENTSWTSVTVKLMEYGYNGSSSWTTHQSNVWTALSSKEKRVPGTVFQDRFWFGGNVNNDLTSAGKLYSVSVTWTWGTNEYLPWDHTDYTDGVIADKDTITTYMSWAITAILNYNNTRLVVACGTDIWVYYPELDQWAISNVYWATGWKKVLHFEAWTTIIGLTCTFEYLKVWAVDEWWNTKVYYYQGNNNLRSTFVYNVIDLTWERVLRVYSINSVDYYITSIDGTDGYVNLNKMIGNVPIMLFHQRAWLDSLDVNYKAPYFVGPTWINAAYKSGRFYIADAYGIFQFKYSPNSFDRGYMKRWLYNNEQVYWVCENKGFLYVSTETHCYAVRLYDTWVDGYQDEWVLISREFEGREWGTVTKMLDEVRLNYELNPGTNNKWTIDVYVSPNNEWKNTHTFTVANKWYKVMHIESENGKTRVEKSNLFNDLWSSSSSSFKFDWQTITYAIVINQSTSTHATPIVRQIDLKYHCKDKTNYVYDIN